MIVEECCEIRNIHAKRTPFGLSDITRLVKQPPLIIQYLYPIFLHKKKADRSGSSPEQLGLLVFVN
jgi:hypothetical protein